MNARLIPDVCPHFPRGISGDHRCDAKLVLIGEAPGRVEDEVGQPFVGPAGRLLESWWWPLGLRRSHFYITNVVSRRPPANKIEAISAAELQLCSEKLRERISQLIDPVVIIPTGNTALRALFGSLYEPKMKITDWRGSILGYNSIEHGRLLKVIPTIHPAATFKQPMQTRLCLADWKRIAEDCKFHELRIPKLEHWINPDVREISEFKSLSRNAEILTVDIETDPKTNRLLLIGFSFDGQLSLTIPVADKLAPDDATNALWNQAAFEFCRWPLPKVLQNGLFDQYHLAWNGFELTHYEYDLIEMDHALNLNDGGDMQKGDEEESAEEGYTISMRGLDVLQSLHTRIPYHKYMTKGAFNPEKWQVYNGIDACSQIQVFHALKGLLEKAGKL